MKHFNVILLGPRGSGKTVYLGSMYHSLSVPGEFNFFVEPSKAIQKKLLNKIYDQVGNPSEEWPDATKFEISEWVFNCQVVSPSLEQFEVFQISYYDYSGGRLTDIILDDDSMEEEFNNLVVNADCILGLLDGHKLLKLMNGKIDEQNYFNQEVNSILQYMGKTKTPSHLIISKWDILRKEFTLDQIKKKLLEYPQFEKVARFKSTNKIPMRLIPVSSIGFEFAVLNSKGIVEKKPNGKLSPYQVEIPIAMVLTDKIKQAFEAAIEREKEIERQRQAIKPLTNYTVWNWLGRMVGGALRLITEHLPTKFEYSQKVLEKIADLCESGYNKKETESIYNSEIEKRELKEQLTFVNDEKTALDYAVSGFISLERKLDYEFPQSKIFFINDL